MVKSCDCDTCNLFVKAMTSRHDSYVNSWDQPLLVEALLKGKKSSKPFHGYNPNRHSRKGGLNAKGRAKFKREQGSNLKPPVTTKPSKLKPVLRKQSVESHFALAWAVSKDQQAKVVN